LIAVVPDLEHIDASFEYGIERGTRQIGDDAPVGIRDVAGQPRAHVGRDWAGVVVPTQHADRRL
jgi:hypothetical protein